MNSELLDVGSPQWAASILRQSLATGWPPSLIVTAWSCPGLIISFDRWIHQTKASIARNVIFLGDATNCFEQWRSASSLQLALSAIALSGNWWHILIAGIWINGSCSGGWPNWRWNNAEMPRTGKYIQANYCGINKNI